MSSGVRENLILSGIILGLWLVDRRLRPTVPPTSPGPLQFSLSKLLIVLTFVAIMMAILSWFEGEHKRTVQRQDEQLQQILDGAAKANSASTTPPTQPVETQIP